MHIVDDKMSNQFSIYSCSKKINDVFSDVRDISLGISLCSSSFDINSYG